jgi:hypothetical protein
LVLALSGLPLLNQLELRTAIGFSRKSVEKMLRKRAVGAGRRVHVPSLTPAALTGKEGKGAADDVHGKDEECERVGDDDAPPLHCDLRHCPGVSARCVAKLRAKNPNSTFLWE